MTQSNPTMAEQVAQAASAFQQQRTGHVPKSVTVVLNEDTLVVTLHGALSPAEQAMAKSPAGAARVQEFHRQLFNSSYKSLLQEITVGELAEACDLPSAMASEHLRLMQRCGLLSSEKEGRKVFYRVSEPHLKGILKCIEGRFGASANH